MTGNQTESIFRPAGVLSLTEGGSTVIPRKPEADVGTLFDGNLIAALTSSRHGNSEKDPEYMDGIYTYVGVSVRST